MTEQEFNHIAERQRSRLLAIARNFLRNEDDADDAVQEALVSLWLFRSRINMEGDVQALLTTITKNVCRMHLRKEKPPTLQLSIMTKAADNPQLDMERRERAAIVMDAIGTLAPQHQLLLQMYYSAELSIQQIATIRNTTPAAVKQMLMRARNLLKIEIERRNI